MNDEFKDILDSLLSSVQGDVSLYANHQITLHLPVISPMKINKICKTAQSIFKQEPFMLSLESPCIIVGDIHGHLLDLIRIIQEYGRPIQKKYVFLGDVVDRGEFSIECILIVFLLKIIYPSNFFIIRGNHEFECLCLQDGFSAELAANYPGLPLFENFINAFSEMPLMAVVDNSALLVHGGIGPTFTNLSQVKYFTKPIQTFGSDFIDALLWSDPANNMSDFIKSPRGIGYKFGFAIFNTFMEENNLALMIRGHECVVDGFDMKFDSRCLTVFSASNYCGIVDNKSAVIELINARSNFFNVHTFAPLNYLKRSQVTFHKAQQQQQLQQQKRVTRASSDCVIPFFSFDKENESTAIASALTSTPTSTSIEATKNKKMSSLYDTNLICAQKKGAPVVVVPTVAQMSVLPDESPERKGVAGKRKQGICAKSGSSMTRMPTLSPSLVSHFTMVSNIVNPNII